MPTIDQKLIKEASILKVQVEKGIVILPALVAFLSKIEGLGEPVTRRMNKKNDRLADVMLRFETGRMKPAKI